MEIFLLGTNHRTAEVKFREQLALSSDDVPSALEEMKKIPGIQEGIIVSTCNRTEVYAVASEPGKIVSSVENMFARISGIEPEESRRYFYNARGQEAIHHLFRVTSGLDSMILGEPQILGQVKDAYRLANENNFTGIMLNRLLNHSFTVGKRVRSETALGAGAVSVAYAAVELAQKIFRDLSRRSVLLIGAGETGELTARHLREKGIGRLFIANRTHQKAENLAADLQGKAIEFSQMQEIFHDVDIIVGAASAPDYLVSLADIEKAVSKRGARPLFMIDIGVPRDFDPQINKLESVFLHDIDALQQIVDLNLEKRRLEIPKAEAIISEEIRNFLEWKEGLRIAPTIVSLRQKLEDIRQAELKKNRNKLSESEFEKADLISRAILNKILHMPTVQLKKFGNGHPEGLLRLDVVREIFGLEEDDE